MAKTKTTKKKTATKTATKTSTKATKATKAATKKAPAKKTTKKKKAEPEVKVDRRARAERRGGGTEDRRQQATKVTEERREGTERRAKVNRRRQIDPTTCERDYNGEEIEFMQALDAYKRAAGRMFPTCSEILEVIRDLGYRRLTPEELMKLGPTNVSEAEGEADEHGAVEDDGLATVAAATEADLERMEDTLDQVEG